jgi:hypothetical protein
VLPWLSDLRRLNNKEVQSASDGGWFHTCVDKARVVGVERHTGAPRKAGGQSLRNERVKRMFGVAQDSAYFSHEDLAQLAAAVCHPTVIRLSAFMLESGVVDAVLMPQVRAGGQGYDTGAPGCAQLGKKMMDLKIALNNGSV